MSEAETLTTYVNTFFKQFEPDLKEKLIQNCSIKTFSAGDIIMETGQYFRSTMIIVEGRVKLYRQGEDGEEFFMYYIEPGGACALSMICAARQEASEIMAKAVEDTVALLMPIHLMDELMRDYKTWYYFVLETYRNRYEELLVLIDHVVFKGMDERLEFYLLNQYQKLNNRQLNISHQEIARDLNSSREVVSRLLKKMEQQGKLKLYRLSIEWLM
ncbi:MAG: Crp/Fnr family transcriptional regulator [Bacteroidota bacterium]